MTTGSVCSVVDLHGIAASIPSDPTAFPPEAAHVLAIAFDDRNTPEVLAEAGEMLVRGNYFNPGLLNAFQYWHLDEVERQRPYIHRLDGTALKALADESIGQIPRYFSDVKYLEAARVMVGAALAVYTLYSVHHVDQRENLENLLRQYPSPLLRIPALSGLSYASMLVFWDRWGIDLVHDDLFSKNPNRRLYAMGDIQRHAKLEELSDSPTNSIRLLANHLGDIDQLREASKKLLPERYMNEEGIKRMCSLLTIPVTLAEVLSPQQQEALSLAVVENVLKEIQGMSQTKLRRLFLEEDGVVMVGAPPLGMMKRVIVIYLRERVKEGKLNRQTARRICEGIQETIMELLPERKNLHSFPNPFLDS